MKYPFHLVDVFSSTPFGGNQLAILPDATGISTEGMQKIAREFNFPESTFVLPKNDPANSYRVRIFTPRAELDFAGHPTIGTACALVMKQQVQAAEPIRLILEENIGPVMVDVARRNGGYHGTLTLSGKIDAPAGAPAPADLATILSIEPAEVSQSFFAGVGVPFCFAQLTSNEAVDRAAVNRAAWTATLSRAWSPHLFFFAGDLRDGGNLYARMCAPALGVEEDPATGSACAALVGAMASKSMILAGQPIAFRSSKVSRWGAEAKSKRRRARAEASLPLSALSGATAYIASGEIEGSAVRACVLVETARHCSGAQ